MAGIATLREQLAKVLAENIPDIKGKKLWICCLMKYQKKYMPLLLCRELRQKKVITP